MHEHDLPFDQCADYITVAVDGPSPDRSPALSRTTTNNQSLGWMNWSVAVSKDRAVREGRAALHWPRTAVAGSTAVARPR